MLQIYIPAGYKPDLDYIYNQQGSRQEEGNNDYSGMVLSNKHNIIQRLG